MRFILGLIGAAFALALTCSLFSGLKTYLTSPPAPLAADKFHLEPKTLHLKSDGPFGKFDKAQLQRGLQVYTEVCSSCHSLKLVSFRDLKGLGYNEAEIKAYAGSGQQWKIEVPTTNPTTGEPATRKALPSDNFPWNFANETAARAANNNALPPDLSLMRSEEHTSELQSRGHLVCRLLLEKKNTTKRSLLHGNRVWNRGTSKDLRREYSVARPFRLHLKHRK